MATATTSRPDASASGSGVSLADVVKTSKGLPSRVVLHGVEGWGKTSFAAMAPSPVFLMTRGETGLETLIDQGRIPPTSHFPEVMTWDKLLASIDALTKHDHPYKTLAIDALNGAERLCHEMVCHRDYRGDWGEKGFTSFQKGYDVALADWRKLLSELDRLREVKRMGIICLCHTQVKSFRNPEGPDYDRFATDLHHKTWGLTHKWADMVLFGNFETFYQDEGKKKTKAVGGQNRVMYTERHAAWDAKNRMGLQAEIQCGNSPQEAWANFQTALKAGRAGK